MILVVLGTQDKEFPRLLEAIDKELEKGTITDRVVVQAGQTHYSSPRMEIFDLLPAPEFDSLMDQADLIITHGGAGSILGAIKKGKKVIAAARLAKYREHHNDHQKQIIGEFASQGYILELTDFQKLGKMIEKSKNFKPKKFESNTKNMIQLLDDYISETNHTAWFHKYHEILSYFFFGMCTTLVNFFAFWIFRTFSVPIYLSNSLAWLLSVLFAFFTNKYFVFQDNRKCSRMILSFLGLRLFSLLIDMGIMYLLIQVLSTHELVAKIVTNVFVVVVNYIFSKLFVFKK